jgi:hypothetical protein
VYSTTPALAKNKTQLYGVILASYQEVPLAIKPPTEFPRLTLWVNPNPPQSVELATREKLANHLVELQLNSPEKLREMLETSWAKLLAGLQSDELQRAADALGLH